MHKRFITLLLALGLSGCSTLTEVNDLNTKLWDEVRKHQQTNTDQVRASAGAVERIKHAKLVGERIDLANKSAEPAWLDDPISYVTVSESLAQIIERLSNRLSVSINYRVEDSSIVRNSMAIDWQGSVRSLFDHLASRTQLHWQVRPNGSIEFIDVDTRTYLVSVPAQKSQLTSSINLGQTGSSSGNSGSGTGSRGGADVRIATDQKIDTFTAVLSGVEAIVRDSPTKGETTSRTSSKGVNGNSDLGMITVTAPPPMHDKVQAYIDAINHRFAQNVLVRVKVLEVTFSRNLSASANLDLVYQSTRNKVETAGGVVNQSGGSSIKISRLVGKWSGSEFLAQALAEHGDVSHQRNGQVMTVNGQAAAMQVVDEINYIESSSTTNTVNIGSSTSVTPGSRTVGFTATFLPVVQPDNRILLNYTMNLSSMYELRRTGSGDSYIETPQIASQSLQQQAYVTDGETIVLFGFEQNRADKTGNFGPWALDGSAGRKQSMLVIVMDITRV